MHSPNKKKLSSNTHQTEHVQLAPTALLFQEMDWREEDRISLFTQCRGLNP
ncbi:unnamed protein product [Staurois parvus]|uniref:Uncharacterized protein n=1 Tax=Staurois parvus TaxID=386267 RepID=A0ABN9FUB5_9NEOB|nr:unnamed protein product [Staurois parvus]